MIKTKRDYGAESVYSREETHTHTHTHTHHQFKDTTPLGGVTRDLQMHVGQPSPRYPPNKVRTPHMHGGPLTDYTILEQEATWQISTTTEAAAKGILYIHQEGRYTPGGRNTPGYIHLEGRLTPGWQIYTRG